MKNRSLLCLLRLQVLWFLGAISALSAPPDKELHSPVNAAVGLPETNKVPTPPAPTPIVADPEIKLVARFDKNGDQQLDANERRAALVYLAQQPPAPPPARPGQLPLQPEALEPVKPGEKIAPTEVPSFLSQPLYAPDAVRTLFLEFDDSEWEKELAEFANTDVLVPARVTVDGSVYAGVGVRARPQAATSPYTAGYKRSLDLTFDYIQAGQSLGGHRQIRLLAASTDPTFLRSMLYSRVAREYVPTPKANYVRVGINGENWGIYVSAQPFDELFVQENFGTTRGARWTVSRGGNLAYLGDNPDAYRGRYRLDSPEDPAAWAALVQLCKLITQTPPKELEAALAPHLDLDRMLKFFALENALINQDGLGSSTGDFGLYLDANGLFHLIPLDAESSFRLVQVTEYGARSRGTGSARGGKPEGTGTATTGGKEAGPGDATKRGYTPNDFPRQSGTNLAMLLSYSFVSKADSDFDQKLTRDEWLTFARTWFMVMDEDFTGVLTREQFITKVRGLVTPASMADGHTKQTFGPEDAAAVIGRDFFAAMDENHDGKLTREELSNTFARWFASWSDPKSSLLTQEAIQRGLTELFTQSVFQADQTYINSRAHLAQEGSEERGGRGQGGGERGRGQDGGSGIGFGPMHLGLGGHGSRGDGSRTLITFSEELDPLAGLDDQTKPLLTKLLAVPGMRVHYLDAVRDITENWLTWSKLGPIAKEYHALIADDVRKDTHKSASYVHFVQELDQDTATGARDGGEAPSLKAFVTERHAYLLKSDALNGDTQQR